LLLIYYVFNEKDMNKWGASWLTHLMTEFCIFAVDLPSFAHYRHLAEKREKELERERESQMRAV
jgi:hypothetical protein